MGQCKQRQRGQQFGVVGTPSPEQRVKAGAVSHTYCYAGSLLPWEELQASSGGQWGNKGFKLGS